MDNEKAFEEKIKDLMNQLKFTMTEQALVRSAEIVVEQIIEKANTQFSDLEGMGDVRKRFYNILSARLDEEADKLAKGEFKVE